MQYICNTFSLNMLPPDGALIVAVPTSTEDVARALARGFISAVGHEGTAKMATELLKLSIPTNRVEVKLRRGDVLFVLQLMKRLEEGKVLTAEEMRNYPLQWWRVEIRG